MQAKGGRCQAEHAWRRRSAFDELGYWREYRTYFHIGQAYVLSESAACRNTKWCENTILCPAHEKGRRHDFRLFKTSRVRLHPETNAVVDSGYQGLQGRHANTAMLKKRSKKNPLSATDKVRNRGISSERVPCEDVIAMLKRFKIIAERYRNRRRRFGLRFFLIAAIYNMELKAA
jgi:hypothetical protein